MGEGLRVVHYLNQFFGGIGGEEKADVGCSVKPGAVGPGQTVQNALGDRGEVVATIICGDNYFVERTEEATQEVLNLLTSYQPSMVIAGPAFNAGRYGVACGEICKTVQDKLGIPAVTAMYEDNPGVELFKKDIYIVKSADTPIGMTDIVSRMVNIACKLAAHEKIGKPAEEGYFTRGFIRNEISDKTTAERAVDMLLAKMRGQPFEPELALPKYDRVSPPAALKDLRSAKIALVTDGGLVPLGNPDQIEIRTATRYGKYSIKDTASLKGEDYEVKHSGYDSLFVQQNPNRLVPVDAMRELESEGVIRKLHDFFYSTTGVANIVETMEKIGTAMAKELKSEGVAGVILTST